MSGFVLEALSLFYTHDHVKIMIIVVLVGAVDMWTETPSCLGFVKIDQDYMMDRAQTQPLVEENARSGFPVWDILGREFG
jgi:hypothetical protein